MFKRWLIRLLGLEGKPDVVFLPYGSSVTTEVYLKACEDITGTGAGRVLVQVLKEKYYVALGMRCPCQGAAQRSEWLAAHDALLAVRKEMLDDLTKNVDLLPPKLDPDRERLGGA